MVKCFGNWLLEEEGSWEDNSKMDDNEIGYEDVIPIDAY